MTRRPPRILRGLERLAFTLLVGLAAGACGAGDPTAEPPSSAAPEGEAVQFEPAYPEEVSGEGLSAEDEAQQAVTHSHGGEAHTHEDGDESDHGDGGHPH